MYNFFRALGHCVSTTVPTEWVHRENTKIKTFFIMPLKKNLNGEKFL